MIKNIFFELQIYDKQLVVDFYSPLPRNLGGSVTNTPLFEVQSKMTVYHRYHYYHNFLSQARSCHYDWINHILIKFNLMPPSSQTFKYEYFRSRKI